MSPHSPYAGSWSGADSLGPVSLTITPAGIVAGAYSGTVKADGSFYWRGAATATGTLQLLPSRLIGNGTVTDGSVTDRYWISLTR